MSSFPAVLSQEDIAWIHSLPEVLEAKDRLEQTLSGKVYFTIPLTDSIRSALRSSFGLDLSGITHLPMRWIQGDTEPHIDQGASEFDHTYLVYLNDSPGTFQIDDASYPISENTGYVFHEGLMHRTMDTGTTPRLLLGPMSEQAIPVGGPTYLIYYANEADALAQINAIDYNFSNYIVGTVSSYSSWRIAQTIPSSAADSTIYQAGFDLQGLYNGKTVYLYPAPSGSCCPGILQLNGVDYTTQYNVVEGNIYSSESRRSFTSYDGYYKLLMYYATRRSQ